MVDQQFEIVSIIHSIIYEISKTSNESFGVYIWVDSGEQDIKNGQRLTVSLTFDLVSWPLAFMYTVTVQMK